ncbi:MAG: biotin--[acetyl-CoA-carboxylase] ligase [Opitutae bacterium]|nr:biotin--[acetyl-CoA-carboxylase] ligase [Opitutae bacterium]
MSSHSPSSELVILRELLAHDPGFVSGSKLADKLGVSRVAVWQHMEKLRAQGFAFHAVRARGYRLTRRPAGLNATFVEALLHGRAQDCQLVLLDEIDSTNDEASRQLGSGREVPFVVIARRQTRGRGRFGRTWHSDKVGNIYASFGFRPLLSPERMQTFTLWMGVNVCELVSTFSKSVPGLKWPNDLLFGGRKAGGMLTEARIDSDQIRDLVFGVGLNVNAASDSWPAEIGRRATTLAEEAQAPLDLNRFTAALIDRVLAAYDQFVAGTYRENFADLWHRFDLLRGKNVAVLQGACRFAGTAAGIDDEGSLLLRDDGGRLQRFRAGEVTLEKNAS